MISLGIDTSCYTTSVAVADEQGVVCSERMLLPVPIGQRGLRQSEAVFAHIRQLPQVFAAAMTRVERSAVRCVCVSAAPRDGEQSYMPVFQCGLSFARVLADAWHVPLLTTTHQRGHIRAALEGAGLQTDRYLAVHLSGGTTEVLLVEGSKLTLAGGSRDLHAGQLMDRVGVALGLPFPAGPSMEQLARNAQAQAQIPISVSEGWCHLSGAEAQAMRWIQAGQMPPEAIAAEVFDAVERSVLRILRCAAEQYDVHHVLMTGGVASSTLLRSHMQSRVQKRRMPFSLHFASPHYAGDCAVGPALTGMDCLKNRKETLLP